MNGLDFHFGKILAMSLMFEVMLPATEFDDSYFVAASLPLDFPFDAGLRQHRRTHLQLRAIGDQQHLITDPQAALFDRELLNAQGIAWRDAVLFTAGLNNCIHD